jgi:hypothetical protein
MIGAAMLPAPAGNRTVEDQQQLQKQRGEKRG